MTLLRYIRKVVVVVVRSQINLIHCPKTFGILDEKAFLFVWL